MGDFPFCPKTGRTPFPLPYHSSGIGTIYIVKFDVKRHAQLWNEAIENTIDILSLGYWYVTGTGDLCYEENTPDEVIGDVEWMAECSSDADELGWCIETLSRLAPIPLGMSRTAYALTGLKQDALAYG